MKRILIPLVRIAATAVSAVAMGAAFPPTSLAPLAWIALVPFLLALRGAGFVTALLLGWFWTLLGAWTVGSWMPEAIASYFLQPRALGWAFFFGVSSLMAAVFYMGFALVYRRAAARLDPRGPAEDRNAADHLPARHARPPGPAGGAPRAPHRPGLRGPHRGRRGVQPDAHDLPHEPAPALTA